MPDDAWLSASDIREALAAGRGSASEIIERTICRIAELNPALNAFTSVTADRARRQAAKIDAKQKAGQPLGPLAGVPFAVKNLFDVAGLPTLAGSKVKATEPAAARDAILIERLEAADAILVGTLNMSEFAYEFTGDNAHFGPSRNPHDLDRMSGGSSGGSASAVAGGLVPLTLASDTSGSIRVPASLCGVVGLKPTYGRLPRSGSFPLAPSFDHVGLMARTTRDVALAYDVAQGNDPRDPVCTRRPIEPVSGRLSRGVSGVRLAMAGGYFAEGLFEEARLALERVGRALNVKHEIILPETERARAAAFLITAAEAAQLHFHRLQKRARDYDPAIRDRLLAAVMIPAAFPTMAQIFRSWYRAQVLEIFRQVDAVIAPATPCTAPLIGEESLVLDGTLVSVRRNLGLYTQPLSFIGLPVVVVPVRVGPLPLGIQIVTRPWNEDLALRLAHRLEEIGAAGAPTPRIGAAGKKQ